jgi:peptidoglycan/LPS O-acetylase OafA/YrhL
MSKAARVIPEFLRILQAPLRLPNRSRATEYRAEIDGLRAIAIISVVGFHIGLPGFGGGFVGVDIFFVISGFVITKLLLNQLQRDGSIDLTSFFARRARRLLPAFLLVAVSTLVLGAFFLMPSEDEQGALANSAMAAALYLSNLHFAWVGDDYFAPDSARLPLLHTWSLAVEEQFYLFWPVLLLGAVWIARRRRCDVTWVVAGMLALIIAASLSYSWLALDATGREARLAFFALYARAWELALGASLALALPATEHSRGRVGAGLAVIGSIAIALGVTVFHPGTPALLPALGTAAIIIGIWLAPDATVGKLLGTRPLVIVGLLSYSWYLWHWPLLALARAHALGTENLWRDAAIAAGAFGLAWLTYAIVEEPVRSRRVGSALSGRAVLGAAIASSFLIIASAQGLHAYAGRLAKTEKFLRLAQAQSDVGWAREKCRNRSGVLLPRSKCMQGVIPASQIIIVWGDSHADHAVGAIEAADTNRQFALLPRWMSGCPPLRGVDPFNIRHGQPQKDCALFNEAVIEEIHELKRHDQLAGVVIAARWSTYVGQPSLAGKISRTLRRNGRVLNGDEAVAALSDGLSATLQALQDINVLLIAPMPEQRFEVPHCLARRSLEYCSVTRPVAEETRRVVLHSVKQALIGAPAVQLWDPLPALCDQRYCPAELDGIIMYLDEEHMTYTGSRHLGRYLHESSAWRVFSSKGKRHTGFLPLCTPDWPLPRRASKRNHDAATIRSYGIAAVRLDGLLSHLSRVQTAQLGG